MKSPSSPSPNPPATTAGKQPSFSGARVLVVGLGRFGGGVGVTRWLAEQGATVTVTDQAAPDALGESIEAIAGLDVSLHLGGHDLKDLDKTDLVVLNPAIDKRRSPFFEAVVESGIPWTTELNLFCRRCSASIIGITGTYGKSTTCAMLTEVLDACCGADGVSFTGVHLGGNIGRSLLTELDSIRATDLVVLEISSAQLEDLPYIEWAPPVALITNLSPHHLDRYGCYEDYLSTKVNIAGDPKGDSRLFAGDIDAEGWALLRRRWPDIARRIEPVPPVEPTIELRVPGLHNQANASGVIAICTHLGLDQTTMRLVMQDFRGLPHRLEYVRTVDGVDYHNDSKSTSPTAIVKALESMSRPMVAIVGGRDNRAPFGQCARKLALLCRAVICVGEAGPSFARAVGDARIGTKSPIIRELNELSDAVAAARELAKPGDAVLFSPGAPSFDRFANFAKRGEAFVELVLAL